MIRLHDRNRALHRPPHRHRRDPDRGRGLCPAGLPGPRIAGLRLVPPGEPDRRAHAPDAGDRPGGAERPGAGLQRDGAAARGGLARSRGTADRAARGHQPAVRGAGVLPDRADARRARRLRLRDRAPDRRGDPYPARASDALQADLRDHGGAARRGLLPAAPGPAAAAGRLPARLAAARAGRGERDAHAPGPGPVEQEHRPPLADRRLQRPGCAGAAHAHRRPEPRGTGRPAPRLPRHRPGRRLVGGRDPTPPPGEPAGPQPPHRRRNRPPGRECWSWRIGGYAATYVACNVVLGLPSVGTSLLWCGVVAGGIGAFGAGFAGAKGGPLLGEWIYEATEPVVGW